MLEVGFAKRDISSFEPGMSLLGWGQRTKNQARGVGVPLEARAMVVHDPRARVRLAYVCADLLVITEALRLGVLARLAADHAELGVGEANLMLTATHTHSGPSGYSHYFWLNIACPGYAPRVLEALVEGLTGAIVDAAKAARPGRLSLAQGTVAPSEGIAFNRSWYAYDRNHDVAPVGFEGRAEAIDPTMTVLRFDAADGSATGMLNWFGLHGTCVHATNTLLHPDHKGLAAIAFERGGPGRHAIFAQEAAGDVSPNDRRCPRRRVTIGRFDDDLESAAFVAEVENRVAERLFDSCGADRGTAFEGPVGATLAYVDFGCAPVAARFAHDGVDATTRPGRLGVAMTLGTAEGPGPLYRTKWLSDLLCRSVRMREGLRASLGRGDAAPCDPKFPLLDLGLGRGKRLFGALPLDRVKLPRVGPIFQYVRGLMDADAFGDDPWMPTLVPVQVFRLGSLAVAATPFEMTTVAARRLRKVLRESLGPKGVTTVVVNTYANAYVGYLTTFEEYQVQHYEAGYTIFGPRSEAALRTAFAAVAEHVNGTGVVSLPGPRPVAVDPERLERQRFQGPWTG
jgi:neutral ceramidase